MKKALVLLFSMLLVLYSLASCSKSTTTPPIEKQKVEKVEKNNHKTAETVGIGAVVGGTIGTILGIICSVATLGIGTVPCMAGSITGGVVVGASGGATIDAVTDN